jgi:DNA-binding transcriptional MerR regulator
MQQGVAVARQLKTSCPPAAPRLPDLVAGLDRDTAGRDHFTIRDLTREFAVTARTLRFYEDKGLLSPRREGEARLYNRRDRARLKYVLMGKSVGFSLEDVREMLDLYDLGDGQQTQLRVALGRFEDRIARLTRQRADIDRALAELTSAKHAVEAMLAARTAAPP